MLIVIVKLNPWVPVIGGVFSPADSVKYISNIFVCQVQERLVGVWALGKKLQASSEV